MLPQLLAKLVPFAAHFASRASIEMAATVAVVTSGLPQLWSLLRGSDGRGISVPTWVVIFASGLLWGAYGFMLHDAYIIATNAFVAVNAATISSITIARRRQRNVVESEGPDTAKHPTVTSTALP
jgi:uncharacterized protein with PQ loop repeat